MEYDIQTSFEILVSLQNSYEGGEYVSRRLTLTKRKKTDTPKTTRRLDDELVLKKIATGRLKQPSVLIFGKKIPVWGNEDNFETTRSETLYSR